MLSYCCHLRPHQHHQPPLPAVAKLAIGPSLWHLIYHLAQVINHWMTYTNT
jgi:hypothetical protein